MRKYCLLLLLLIRLPAGAAENPDYEAVFSSALERAARLPRLYSLLVSHRGEVVLERYFNGKEAGDIANIKSASKSVISALVGAAIAEGHLEGVEQPIGEFFPERLAGPDRARHRAITLEDLLTMRAGLESTSNRYYGRWVLSGDWIDFAFDQPFLAEPGTEMEYSTGSTHLLSAILTRATGESTLAFAREVLGQPLGFHLNAWPTDPQGIYFGGNDMEFTPRQMLRFGEMYLDGGMYEGRRVLPEAWVEASLRPRTVSPRRRDGEPPRRYGYGWWIREMAGHDAAYAWGYGGQFILLVEDLDLVIVTTSSSFPGDGRREHTRAIYDLVEFGVIAPLSRTESPTPAPSRSATAPPAAPTSPPPLVRTAR